MGTIHREGGLQFRIFTNDHEPPHVHVFQGKGRGASQVKIDISDLEAGPQLIEVIGSMSRSDVKKAFEIVRNRQKEMLVAWSQIHD